MEAVADQPKVLVGNPGVLVVDPTKVPAPDKFSILKPPCNCGLCRSLREQPREALDVWKRATLEWVNMLRTEWGHSALDELPRGRRNSKHDCVVANALGPIASAVPGNIVRLSDGHEVSTPEFVQRFIVAFDGGGFPELVA